MRLEKTNRLALSSDCTCRKEQDEHLGLEMDPDRRQLAASKYPSHVHVLAQSKSRHNSRPDTLK